MKIFQYKILANKVFKKSVITEDNLNQLGKQGWELVSVQLSESGLQTAYFKKEI